MIDTKYPRAFVLPVAIPVLLANCSNDSPTEENLTASPCGGENTTGKTIAVSQLTAEPAEPACTPEIVMDNLQRAFDERDKELYESLIDDRFWFSEADCVGEPVFANGKEEELRIIGRLEASSDQGIFDIYQTLEFEFIVVDSLIAAGEEFPISSEGDPDAHSDEDWKVYSGRSQILLL